MKKQAKKPIKSINSMKNMEEEAKSKPKACQKAPKRRGTLRKWIKEEFNSPAEFFAALDGHKKGKVARHGFVSFCVNRSFKAAESDINRVYDCIDTGPERASGGLHRP